MNGKAAKRIRYAAQGMGLQHKPTEVAANTLFGKNSKPAKACERTRTITRLKREYYAKPYHLREVKESHSFVLGVKHGINTRQWPAPKGKLK